MRIGFQILMLLEKIQINLQGTFTGLNNDKAYGIFFDNTFRSYFDFANERRTSWFGLKVVK